MAQAFNLTAQLNLRGPRNVNAIVSRINRQLSNINANVNLNINRNTQTAINNVNAALTNLNGTLANTATNAGNVTAAINNLTGALTAMGNLNVNQQLNNTANAVQQLGNNAGNAARGGGGAGGGVNQLRTELEEFGRQSALAVRRFAAFSLVTSVIFSLSNAFDKAFKSFVDFDKEFVRLQQVTGESASGLKGLEKTITSLASNLGISSAELATVSSTLAQAGLTARDTEKALKALALSALAPSFDNMNNTVEGSIALMRQFGISAGQLEASLGSVNAVAAAFAVEAGDIIAAIQRTGGVFASASKGVSEGTDALNEFIAIFTSVRQTTRESAETIATGLRTIFTRIQRSSTIEALKEFNVNLTDAEGKFVGAYKAIELLSRGLNSIDPRDLKFSEIVEELGGFRQIGKVIPLIQQFDTAQRALAVAQAGQTSLTEDAAIAQLSLANQFAKVREEFLAMVREIGGTDTFQTLVKGALALASGLIKLADSAKSVLPVIAAITAFRGLGAARQFGRGFIGGIRGNANGGMIRAYQKGGMVPVALMPGETVVYPDTVSKIGVSKLRKLNHADKKMARGGGVGLVPGTGRTDSFYTSLPEGSFVIRTDATRALGGPKGVLAAGSNVQKFKRGTSKKLKKRPDEPRDEDGRTREDFYADMVSKRRRPMVDEDGRTREQFYADMVRGSLDDINRAKRRKFAAGGMTLKSITSSGAQGAPTLRALMVKDQDDAFRSGKAINASDKFNQAYTTELYNSNRIGTLVKRHYRTLKDREQIINNLTLQTQQTARGTAFEDLLQKSGVAGRKDFYQSPLDFASGNSAAEAKWQTGAVTTATMISKSIRQKLADNAFRSLKDARQKPPSPETNQVFPKLYNRLTLHKRAGVFDPEIAKKTAGIIDDDGQQDMQPQKNVSRSVAKTKRKQSAFFGGIIQKFKAGSSKPLESMGRSDLIDEARRLGVGYSYQDLGKRGEIGAQARAKLIQELESKRQIQRIGEQQSAARAAQRQVAVIGLAASEGIRGSSEQVKLPGIKEAGKTQRDLDATLNIGALEGKVSQRTQAVLRNSAIRGSMKAAKVMAQAAGESASLQSLQQQVALRQKLKSVPSEMMGFGFQSSILGLQGQMTPSGSADLAGGLSKSYADLFGVPANVPTDITLGGTEGDRLREEAKRKATGTRQTKRGRSGSQFRRAFTGKALGGILKLASGDMAKANPATESLKKYFRSSSKVNLGLAYSEKLSKEQRQNLAKEVKNIRSLATPAPSTVYSAISRLAFDQIARQTGLNKNPEIPEGTTLSQQDKFYQQAVQQMTGKSFKLPGFVSTSKDYSVAKRFLDNAPRDKSKWAAMVTMNTKAKARGIDVEQQLQGQQINNTKTMKNRRSGKMETFKMKGPADEKEVLLPPRSRFRITSAKYAEVFGNKNAWLNVQQLKRGGITNAPLIDDIIGSIPGTYPPVPSGTKLTPALEKIIAAGGGLLDYDGTLMKHTGDEAYARAKTPQEKEAVLSKYYRSEKDRLASGRPTTFARELQKAIKQGLIKPADLSVVSMSKRLPIVEQDIMNRFGIPKDNLIFTQGGSKAKAVEAFRTKGPRASRVKRAAGGDIPIMAQEGEYVINKDSAQAIGYGNLETLNKYHNGGKVQKMNRGGLPDRLGSQATLGSSVGGLGPVAKTFTLLDRTLGKLLNPLANLRSNLNKTAGNMALIESTLPGLSTSLIENARANNRSAISQQKVFASVAQNIQSLQKQNVSQTEIVRSLQRYQRTITNDTAIKDHFARTTQGASRTTSKFGSMLRSTASALKTGFQTAASTVTSAASSTATMMMRGAGSFFGRGGGGGMPPVGMPPGGMPPGGGGAAGAANRGGQRRDGGGMGMGLMFGIPMLADMLSGGEPASEQQAATQSMISGTATGAGIGAMFGPLGMAAGALGGFVVGLAGVQKEIDKFTINKAKMTIEDSGEKISKVLEDVAKAGKATPAQLTELNRALNESTQAALLSAEASKPKASVGQILTEIFTAATLGGEASSNKTQIDTRAAIYEKQGFMGLMQAQLGGAGVEAQMFRDIAPSIAREAAKGFATVAAQARTVFEQQFKSGKSITDIMNAPEWSKQSEVLARSNAAVQEQLLLIQASNNLTAAQKEALSKNIIAAEAETQLRKQFAEVKAAEDLKKLQSSINRVSFSFNRMLGNMDAAIQRSVDSLTQFNENVSLAAASAAGQAKVGSSGGINQILNVLKNPQAYGGAERSSAFASASASFGSQSGNIERILGIGSSLESSVLSTINRTLSGSKGETDEAVSGKITSDIKAQLKNLQLPPALADKLSQQIGKAVAKLRSSGEDTVDFTQLVEEVPELGKSIDIFKNTSDAASKALESVNKSFDMLADATNQYIDLIVESNSRLRAAQSIVAKGSMDLKRALGGNVSLGERRSAIEAPIRSMTGGATDPAAIAANQRRLEADRVRLQSGRDQAARAQDVGAVRAFDDQLAQTSIGLRENVAALKQMADSSELASAALEEIDKVQKKQQAGIGIMEKLVTSTPKELSKMNQAFARLDANMRGVAIGGTSPEQRKETLDAFQMIAPFLGDQEKGLQANVLQSMLMESGVGVSPMMQQILDGMRNPQADPQQALAIATYQEAIDTQARANEELAAMNMQLGDDISKKTGDAVAKAIANTRIQFEKQQIEDLINRINVVPTPNNPAATLASGGIVYKALGGNIDRTVFKPKGTDTVPAMLTPGEFVVNRKATQSNLPLLKSINNGYSKGGKVKYLSGGGYVSNILKSDTMRADDTMVTGVSTKDLPIVDPFVMPKKDNSTVLNMTDAKIFASIPGPEGPSKELQNFIQEMKQRGRTWSEWWNNDVNDPDSFFSEPLGTQLKINRPLNFGAVKSVLGVAPSSRHSIQVTEFFGNATPIPMTKPIESDPVIENTATIPLGISPELINKLKGGASIGAIGYSQLNASRRTIVDPFSYGATTLQDIRSNPRSDFASASTQMAMMEAAVRILKEKEGAFETAKGQIIFEDDTIPDIKVDLPKTVKGLYGLAKGNQELVPTKKIAGKYMAPTINVTDTPVASVVPSTELYPGSTDFSRSFAKYYGIGAAKSGAKTLNTAATIKKADLENIYKSLAVSQTEIEKAYAELNREIKSDPNLFTGTSSEQKRYGGIHLSLAKIASGNIAGLYETIAFNNEDIDDKWKSELGSGPLHVFSSKINPNEWTDAIQRANANTDALFQSKFKNELKGFGVTSDKPVTVAKPGVASFGYKWLSGNTDIVKEFVDKFFKAQQKKAEKDYRSPFDIEEETKTATFDTRIPLNKLDAGLGEGTLKAAYSYKSIKDMPKLSPNNGYLVGGDRIKNALLLESGIAPSTDKQTISDILRMPEGQIGIAYQQQLEAEISRALSDYILNKNIGASITGLTSVRRIGTADASWIPSSEKNAFGIMGQIDPMQIDEMVQNFKQNALITGGAEGNRVVGAQIAPIGDPLAASVALLNNVVGPVFGTLQKFGYGLYPLTAAAQIGPYSEGLMALSKSFGQRIVSPQDGKVDPKLAAVWGQVTAVGEAMQLISKNDMAGLSSKIGLSQSAIGLGAAGLVQQVKVYGAFLAGQGMLMAGVSGQARQVLEGTVGGDQLIPMAGAKPGSKGRSINDIFKESTEASIDQEGKISSRQATPPKNLLDIGKKALNPYNTFSQPNDRASLLDYLINQLISQKLVNNTFVAGWDSLRNYLYDQDTVSTAKDPAATLTADLKKKMNERYKIANAVLLALTNGEFGQLPGPEKILQIAAFNKSQARAKDEKAQEKDPAKMSSGGVVYASNGTLVNYQPRGTDTVPAMLTPGEFVVNRSSTQKHLPLLRAINSGSNNLTSLSSSFSNGGLVNYLQNGGIILPKYYSNGTSGVVAGGGTASGIPKVALDASKAGQQITDALTTGTNALTRILGTFGFDSNQLNAISGFINGLKTVTDALANVNITPTVKFEMAPVQVNITGASNLTQAAESIVNETISKWFTDFLDKNQQANMTPPSPLNK